ncbi:MAG TPA: LytTR family DNA-binding domain-containing protein [Williamwhitmania sp.]|nr:LytTR family DNA-binding domain-containing protein [Williamwhitmania sp.]
MGGRIWVKRGIHLTSIELGKVIYIEGDKHGCTFHLLSNSDHQTHCGGRKTHGTLSFLEKALNQHGFIRCHRNYIINPSLANNFCRHKSCIEVDGITIPVARRKKGKIEECLCLSANL